MSYIDKLEADTFAGASIRAWKDQAAKAGLALRFTSTETDSGDFPDSIYSQLRRFRRNISITQNHTKIVTSISRQLINTRDEKTGRPTKTEFITYRGFYRGTTRKGEEYHADFEIGKYQRPRIVYNSDIRYNPKTGEPVGDEKILSGSETVYTIEVPKSKTERKKLIDEVIGDNFTEEIKYYFKSFDELPRRDPTFSYDDFVNCSIQELSKLSYQGGGSRTPGIWRDNDGKLRGKFGQLLSSESGNKEAYR